ncbi:MAG TPA: hypothetical protein VGP38_02120, partial [Rubrobacter sp.]|nr:hypothetical protein [Rubrobacter sp.]
DSIIRANLQESGKEWNHDREVSLKCGAPARGDRSFALAAEFDRTVQRAISVWCRPFAVNFIAAPLR